MRKFIRLIVVASFFLSAAVFAEQDRTADISPVGYWKTIDDVNNRPKAIVQLWESSNHILYGKILKVFPQPDEKLNEVCVACKGEKHNQRIIGLVILENLKQDKNEATIWSGGTILDPKNGKVCHSKVQVVDNGHKLNVRGYIGVSLFGRTQTWLRVVENTSS